MSLLRSLVFYVLFYGVIPGWVTISGAGIILAGALLLAFREAKVPRKGALQRRAQ